MGETAEENDDRLFVPLKTEHFEAFKSGKKDIELRGFGGRFNMETVVPGRRVELRRGYSTGDSLWGSIESVHHFLHIDRIPNRKDHERIHPGATEQEFIESARELLGDYSSWIAFKIRLDEQ